MDVEGPSRTALATAYARAYHQIADRPRILVDPLAARLVGVTADELAEMAAPSVGRPGGALSRTRRLFFAARARFAEDRVAAAAAAGARQVVILGAGMDTFALRNPHPGVRVFEVDHPATQAFKRRRLAETGIDVPETAIFVPVDFETGVLADELASAGFRRDDPAVFVWLGVVYYLSPEAVRATLGYVVEQAAPTDVVFDYLQPGDTDEDRARRSDRAQRVAAAGEPWFCYFRPGDIAAQLRGMGFSEVEDHSAAELIDGYLGGEPTFGTDTPDALRPSRIVRASR